MITSNRHGGLVLLLTFAIALMLTILPLPEWVRLYRPQWVTLVLIYWCLALPDRVSVGTGFIAGLLVDVLTGTLLGQHALGMSIVAYISVQTHQRLRLFPLWQQSLSVMVLLLLEHLLSFWIIGITQKQPPGLNYWFIPLVGTLFWPWVFVMLRDVRRRFNVT